MAFASTTEWDVRTTGSDTNGGGFNTSATGTNYSIQDSPQFTYTDLVIDGTTNTKCTSAAHPFDSTSPGNIINVTSGTGFSVQRVQVVSVSGSTATCDKSLGTLSSTGGNGKLGGGLATIATANGLAIDSNTIHIKEGTYTHTASVAVPVANMAWIGYSSTHRDDGTKPLITTATNSVNLITTGSNAGNQIFRNLSLSNTAGTRGYGLLQLVTHGTTQYWVVIGCIFDGFSNAMNADNVGANWDLNQIFVEKTEIKNCTSHGIANNVGTIWAYDSWFHANGGDGIHNRGSFLLVKTSVFSGNTGSGIDANSAVVLISGSAFSANSSKGVALSNTSPIVTIQNSIFFGNAASSNIYFISALGSILMSQSISCNNAYPSGGNTNWGTSVGDVTLTVSPFTSTSDFSLNSTAGGGAACKAVGFPGIAPFGTGAADIGAVQTAAGTSASGGAFTFMG